jgi:glycosyltransferase involved in cell wall biosynthesis
MKVALVHDYIKEYGGAERVLEALHELFPDAPVYTSVYLPEFLGPHQARFKNWKIKTSFLQRFPFKAKLISPFRLLSPFAFKAFDFSEYDVIIVSATGAYFPNMLLKKNAVHICYCHTPPRYLYGYKTAREWKKYPILNLLGHIANHFLRMVDAHTSTHVDHYIANSHEVSGRIKKFYRREAEVIYPPVDISTKSQISNNKNKNREAYFVTGGRLARAKHPGLVIRACSELGIRLKVFGRAFAGYGEELQDLAGESVEFFGEVTEEKKKELIRNAKAAIFAFEDEDFGILPVEVMGEGTSVIAYKSGGLKETIIDGKTGVFFDELSVDGVKKGIMKFEKTNIDPKDCRIQAEKFNEERFKKAIIAFVKQVTS